MDTGLVVILVFAALFLLLAAGVPVAYGLLVSGTGGLFALSGTTTTLGYLGGNPYGIGNFAFIVVPMFILMGMVVLRVGLATTIYAIAARHLRVLPGEVALATVAACAGFAAVTGSSIATVATLGKLCIGEMERHGYPKYFAAAVVGSCGTLGALIPPSVALVLFGLVTSTSIGALLLAGILPGIVSALVYAGLIMIMVQRGIVRTDDTESAAAALATSLQAAPGAVQHPLPSEPHTVELLRPRDYLALAELGFMFFAVVGGVYYGWYTASESGALGVLGASLLLALRHWRRLGRLASDLWQASIDAIKLNATIFPILLGSSIFSGFIVRSGLPRTLANWVMELGLPPLVVVVALLLLLIPLGMFLDGASIIIVAGPIILAPVAALGYSAIWLGILFVKMLEIGLMTPPVGLNAYVLVGVRPDLKVERIFRAFLPFYTADVITIALLVAFPAIILMLPVQAGLA